MLQITDMAIVPSCVVTWYSWQTGHSWCQ